MDKQINNVNQPLSSVYFFQLKGRPFEVQEDEAPKFLDNRYMKLVKFQALRTGGLHTPRDIPGTHFC